MMHGPINIRFLWQSKPLSFLHHCTHVITLSVSC